MRRPPLCSKPVRSAIAAVVAAGLAAPTTLAPARAEAASVLAVVGPAASSAKNLEQAQALYEQGKSHFDLFQYEKAAEVWTQAYGKVPDDRPAVKNRIVYNIATAQEKAYEMDRDIAHLRQAEQLLRTYVENYKRLFDKTPETKKEVDKANERIRELQERIRKAERGEDPAPAAGPEPAPTAPQARYGSGEIDGIPWGSTEAPPPNPELLAENRRLAGEEKKTDTLIVAGYVVGSLGLFFLLVGAGGLVGARAADETASGDDDDDDDSSETGVRAGRGVGYGGLAIGVAGVAAGATLLGVGFSRRNKARNRTLSLSPAIGPNSAGLSISGRF